MEELYILSDGSQVDVSNFSEFERTKFFIKNPGAKKQSGTAKSADAVPKKNQALNKRTDSSSEDGSSDSKKLRLADEQDLEFAQKKGIMPPPSTQPRVAVDDYNTLYNLKKNRPETSAETFTTAPIKLPGEKTARKIKLITSDTDMKDYAENFRDNTQTGELGYNNEYKIQKTKEKIKQTDADLLHPHLNYSSANQGQEDNFIEENYNSKELAGLGIDTQDFDGYLNKKGYKQDYLNKREEGLYKGEGADFGTGYDVKLAEELAKKRMLNLYMEEMQRRDFTRQDLNQDIEIASGGRKEKQIQKNQLFNQDGIAKYVENNFPVLTQKLKERDVENAKLYKEAKTGGTDFFSWDTASKMGKAGWNAIVDRTNQLSANAYDVIGMDQTAEGIRAMDAENQLLKPDDRGFAYVSGKTVDYAGTKYIVDERGEIYDAGAKIRVTDLFDEKTHNTLVENAKYAPSDWSFSTQGAAVQTSGVMADMILQAALTKGVGEFGAIATETRAALNGAKKASAFTNLLNDTSQLLKAVPIERSVGYSIIGQSALGYTEGYENTLKATRDNGITEKEAVKLATRAGQGMAVLYAATGEINPQTELVEKLFGSKQIVENAVKQYMKTGEKGFVNYIDNMIKNAPKNLIEFVEEGGKEVVQENIQQMGEMGVNKKTNLDAGKKIMNDVMSGDDFMNTSILSFISSGLMSKIKLPNFEKGTETEDDLMSLSTLAKNKKEFDKVTKNLVDKKVFTQEQVDNLKQDVDIYYNNVNKLPKSTSAEVAMPVMRELDKVQKLVDEKQSVDKAFHEDIDDKIDDIRENIRKITYADQLRIRNKAAAAAIKKGIIKNTQMLTFSNKQEMVTYLRENMNMTQEKAEDFASQGGFMMNANNLRHYLKDASNVADNQKMIFVNEGVSVRQGNVTVGQHEFLHGLIAETIKDDPEAQQLLGKALADELLKMQNKVDVKGTGESVLPKQFIQRFGNYVSKYQGLISTAKQALDAGQITKAEYDSKVRVFLGNQWEEALTLYSDAIANGSVKYDEGTFTRLKDTIRQVLQFLGVKNIEFNSGKDVYNFLKDYNKSMETGYWGLAMKRAGNKGISVNKEALKNELGQNKTTQTTTKTNVESEVKFALSDKRKTTEQIKKDINKNYEKDTFLKKINSDRGTTLYDILDEYEYIIREKSRKYQNLPDFSALDFESEVQIALIPHIRNFNKEFLEKREEYKKELIDKGEDPNSQKFKDKVEKHDEEGYEGKKGIVKENKDLNAWINSQLENKIKIALKTGNVTSQKFTDDIDDERFKETRILGDFSGDQGEESEMFGENDEVFDAQQDFEEEQNKLAVLLRDPVFRFTDEDGEPINIETVPFGGFFVTEATDPTVAANIKLKKETDPAKREELLKELRDFERGLELQQKDVLTPEEKDELKGLRSFKSYDLSTGMMVNTFKALSIEDTPAKIITDEVAREILRSPNVETLEYRNFKEKLSTLSKTMARRMTFKNGPEIESFLYKNWDLLYKVINHPVDPVTGESSYASKKLPPRLKEFDDKGNLRKVKGITRTQFLQSYYGVDEATRIIKKYGGNDIDSQLREFESEEKNEKTGNNLVPTAYFDRRTALMELFGDVLVLQEARRLLRNTEFLERVGERNVNLYNQLKDDIVRAAVLQDMAKGKSEEVKFTLAESVESKKFLSNFKELTNSETYKNFTNKIKDIYHSGSEVENYWNEHKIKVVWFTTGQPDTDYGDGIVYRTKLSDVPGTIIIPDSNRSDGQWSKRFLEKFPDVSEELIKDIYKKEPESRIKYIQDKDGNQVYEDGVIPNFSKYAEERLPENLKQFSNLGVDSFIEKGREIGYYDKFREIVDYFYKYKYSLKPLKKEMSFQEFKEENELNPKSPSVFWLLEPKNIKYADKVFLEFIKFYQEDPSKAVPMSEGTYDKEDGSFGDFNEMILIGPMDNYKIEKEDKNGKFEEIKFSLLDKVEDAIYKRKFKKLINSKEYTAFYNNLKGQELYHAGSKSIEGTIAKDKVRAMWFYVDWDTMGKDQYIPNDNGGLDFEPFYGDGVIYKTKPENIPGAIIIPDIDFAGNKFKAMIARKYPKAIDQMIDNFSEKQKTDWELFFNQAGYYPFEIRNILATNYANEIIIDFIKELSSPQYAQDSSFLISLKKGEDYSGLPVIAFGKMKTRNLIQKENQKGGYDYIKFSLAEQENAKFSLFMNGLPLSQQWIVARDIDDAILAAKTATSAEAEVIDKLNKNIEKETDPVKLKDLKEQLEEIKKKGKITFKVPSRSKETDKSTAYLIISKVAEGYNDFEFIIKKNADGPLTRQVLDALDFKSKSVQKTMMLNGNLEQAMNDIIEENEGVESSETFSPETAKNLGKNIGRFDIYLPPGDEDFLGLMYTLANGKGQKGEKQQQFFVDNLLKPYSEAMLNLMKARQTMYKDWKNLVYKDHKGIIKLLKKDSGYGGYLYDQAVRVYLWKKAGYKIPGLDKKDEFQLRNIVRTNPQLREFADAVSLMSKQANGYIEPDHNWGYGSVLGDMNNIISKSNRTKFLEQWQSNADKIFSKQNMAKIEAVYGTRYARALKNMLERMKTGSNRLEGSNDKFLNWLNESTAVTMFWNTRSAMLQVLGAINYVNTSDNNILKIGQTLANPKQWVSDFLTVWNSNYSRDRRSGLMNDVAEAELAQLMNDSRNVSVLDKVKAFKYWVLKSGFGATRVMDSFAIALGGASFYRNRLKTYLKQGYSEEDAKKATWKDFYEVSEQSQQSADVSKISMNQASTKGRLLLSFLNTPFQYSRLIKRATVDLVKGRGSVPNNIAKIVYYAAIQNVLFNALQNALFARMFGDDDDEEINPDEMRMWNGALDTLIRGTGTTGVILAAVKNSILKWYEKSGDPKGYGDVLLELSNLSPSIGIKLRAFAKAYKAFEYNKAEIMYKGFSLDNQYAIEALTSLTSGSSGYPADRLYQKIQNLRDAANNEFETWQRIAMLAGYSKWNLGLGPKAKTKSNTSEESDMPDVEMEDVEMPDAE